MSRNFQEGDIVIFKKLKKKGVIRSKLRGGKCKIELKGGINLLCKEDEIEHISNNNPVAGNVMINVHLAKKETNKKWEIDLHGLTKDEAEDAIINLINSALLANQLQLTIIHGKGSGKLKDKTHSILKEHRAVKHYKLEYNNEGTTVVWLKKI